MTKLRVLLSRIVDPFVRRRREQELTEEIQSHLDLLMEEYLRSGMSPETARTAARRAFGGIEQVKEAYRDQRGFAFIDSLRQDLVFALRVLAKDCRVTAVTVLVLGLGLGASTALFSIADGLLFRSLPVRDPEELVHVTFPQESGRHFWATYPAWEEIRERKLFAGALAWSSERLRLSEGGREESVEGIWVSSGFFDVLGVSPRLGRVFHDRDEPQAPVAVISHAFWQRRFGGDSSILGRPAILERVPFTIVGVTGQGFFGPEVGVRFDVAIPLQTMPLVPGRERSLQNPPPTYVRILARLQPGQTIDQATRALRRAQPEIRRASVPSMWAAQYREAYMKDPLTAVPGANGVSSLRRRYEEPVWVLTAVVALMTLIACSNAAILLLTRATARHRELGIRSALGASRVRILRPLFLEAFLLSTAAAAVGLLVGIGASRLLVHQMKTVLESVFLDLSLNGRVAAFTAAAGVATALILGIAPAFRATRVAPIDSVKEYGPWNLETRRLGPGGALVVVQVALSLVLAVGAGLFLRTFSTLANLDLGFDPGGMLVADVDATAIEIESHERPALYERMCEAARSLPGVSSAACSPAIPIGFRAGMTLIKAPEEPSLSEQERSIHKNWITPGWLDTFGTRLLAGRDFGEEDRAGAPLVALVNQAFAARFLNGRDPVGSRVREDRRSEGVVELTVVGVVEDAAYRSVREPAPPTLYVPLGQADRLIPVLNVAVRPAARHPAALAASLRAALREISPELRLTIVLLDEQVRATFNHERVLALLSSLFGGLALALAALGLYGVTAYGVRRRRREIGIRMALGADGKRVLRLVLGRVALMVSIGIGVGSLLSLWAAGFVQSLLFGLPAREPSLFAGAAAALVLAAILATCRPAWQAVRIAPAGVLRDE